MLFEEQIARKPNLYPWTQDFIDKIWTGFWTPNEFDFSSDYAQFKSEMSDEERQIVVRTLSAIGQIEIAVKTFWAKLGENLPHPALSDLGYAMANSEVIHNLAYEKLLDRLRLNDVFQENLKEPVVSGRVNYLRKYLKKVYSNNRKQYIYSIILFTLFVENVSLFSQFYVILWFKRYKNWLKDTAQQVAYTRNEEAIHAQVGIKLINTLRQEYPDLFDDELVDRIRSECRDAFTAESKIIDWMIGDYQDTGISAAHLKAFIQGRFDDSLASIGFAPIFKDEIDQGLLAKTVWLDEEVLGNNLVDFFHAKPTDYAKKNKSYNPADLF